MSYFVVDVESDGPSPAGHSMVCFGVVKVSDPTKTFYGRVKPISSTWEPDALAVSGFTRKEHENFDNPEEVMKNFVIWLEANSDGKPTFISDNVAFDWSFISFYMWKFVGKNPFGFSGRRIGDLYCGLMKDAGVNAVWKRKYRKTRHTHNPVDDAMGNAEALIAFRDELGLKIKF